MGGELNLKNDKNSNKTNKVNIWTIGGDMKSRYQIHQMREILSEYKGNMNQDILTGRVENAWLDLKTGEVSRFDVDPSLKSSMIPKDMAMRVMLSGPMLNRRRP